MATGLLIFHPSIKYPSIKFIFSFAQVPVHTVPKNEDSFIHFDKKCPKYDILYQYFSQQSPKVREIYAKYGHLFPYWAQMSGIEIYSLESIAFLYKKLITDAGQNMPLVVSLILITFCSQY